MDRTKLEVLTLACSPNIPSLLLCVLDFRLERLSVAILAQIRLCEEIFLLWQERFGWTAECRFSRPNRIAGNLLLVPSIESGSLSVRFFSPTLLWRVLFRLGAD